MPGHEVPCAPGNGGPTCSVTAGMAPGNGGQLAAARHTFEQRRDTPPTLSKAKALLSNPSSGSGAGAGPPVPAHQIQCWGLLIRRIQPRGSWIR